MTSSVVSSAASFADSLTESSTIAPTAHAKTIGFSPEEHSLSRIFEFEGSQSGAMSDELPRREVSEILKDLAAATESCDRLKKEIQDRLSADGEPPLQIESGWFLADEICAKVGIPRPEWMPSLIQPTDILAIAADCEDRHAAITALKLARKMGPNHAGFSMLYVAVFTSVISDHFKIHTKSKVSEHEVADRLAIAVQGKREVLTPSGRIDVLSPSQVIEVKRAAKWRGALGQVLDYAQHYTSHGRRIHLCDVPAAFDFQKVLAACASVDVVVTWEEAADAR